MNSFFIIIKNIIHDDRSQLNSNPVLALIATEFNISIEIIEIHSKWAIVDITILQLFL